MKAIRVAAASAERLAMPEDRGSEVWLANASLTGASLSVIRYTPLRPFVVASNTTAGDLAHLKPPARKRRSRKVSSDAVVGGGAGADGHRGRPSPTA